ncbi:hypothetical protein GCM10027605_57280 [Micromonospora zhanjiangensis]
MPIYPGPTPPETATSTGISVSFDTPTNPAVGDEPPAVGSEAEPAQLLRVALPLLGHPDVQVEIDPGAE